ncbi:MAG: Type 1 glutamine amidotransferase-like domain-containing protein [Propionibacteriaceae bacterium]|jgi:dipeptidase E|nr:Type 1 glutamine amidotransferase-like domain-containing protein [Propionibacteriaceae bacterium]
MSTLFLASFFKQVASLFPEFAGHACEGKTVCFIPTAANPEKVKFYVGADRKALTGLGMSVTDLDISAAPAGEIASGLAEADYVFVSGGNTFYLLQELRRSGADQLIVEQISAGKTYIGASAGSMILVKDISYVQHMDSPAAAPNLDGDFTALGVVDFCVVPHATNTPFKKAASRIQTSYADSLDLRPISNNQAITVSGDRIDILTA